MENVLTAFSLTLLAGLATGVGSALAFFAKRSNRSFLSVALGFSAGVMIYVSFVEILSKARDSLSHAYGPTPGAWYTALSFFGGIVIIAVIDRLVPSFENPHEARTVELMDKPGDQPNAGQAADGQSAASTSNDARLMRMGYMSALAIAIHNFPEGLATFTAAIKDPAVGVAIAVAIAIHNIPEGIAVSVPIFYATGNRKKAFIYSFLSGLSEPVGALIGYVILLHIFSDAVFGVLFASVAGIMVFISLDELLPTAREYGKPHLAIYGLIAGMAVMAASLLLFL